MPAKKRKASSPLSDGSVELEETSEFQQITKADFVDRYRVRDLGEGGDVFYQPDLVDETLADTWYEELSKLETWYRPTLKIYGKTILQSRAIAAYSTTPAATLKYSNADIQMHYPFPPLLADICTRVEEAVGVKFNHCMLNWYGDGQVYIGRHSDNLNNKVIASLSLGAPRTFILSPRLPAKKSAEAKKVKPSELSGRKNVKWTLSNGSLTVMQGRTQEYWKHEIPKEASVKAGRISLTFRQLV